MPIGGANVGGPHDETGGRDGGAQAGAQLCGVAVLCSGCTRVVGTPLHPAALPCTGDVGVFKIHLESHRNVCTISDAREKGHIKQSSESSKNLIFNRRCIILNLTFRFP